MHYLIDKEGVEEFCGVSDSTLKYLIDAIEKSEYEYHPFTNEGDAVAYAAGRSICGHKVAVLMQNSGLTNASSSISSLASLYNIPMIYVVGWRGRPYYKDEPQHEIIGQNTVDLIESISRSYDHFIYDVDREMVYGIYGKVWYTDESNPMIPEAEISRTCAHYYLVSPGSLTSDDETDKEKIFDSKFVDRPVYIESILQEIRESRDDYILVSTTGFTSRELMQLTNDDVRNFPMLGSMGEIVPFAYGLAKSNLDKKVIILDGDGSFLMRPQGTFVLEEEFDNINNVIHIIFNNGCHLSTGGQKIKSKYIYQLLKSISNYVYQIDNVSTFCRLLKTELRSPCRSTFVVNTSCNTFEDLPRPKRSPDEIRRDFQRWLNV